MPLCLIAIGSLAAMLRLHNLTDRGLLYWDESKFALEGLRMETVIRDLFVPHGLIGAGKAVGTAKPSHALLIAVAYALVGVHDYAPLLIDTVGSLGGVALTFLIARRLFGTPTALLSAAFLAVAQYDVVYARSALSESDANLFFLAGVALWLRSVPVSPRRRRGLQAGHRAPQAFDWDNRVREDGDIVPGGHRAKALFYDGTWARLAGAGVLMGIGFTTNYRLIVYIAAAVLIDLIGSFVAVRRFVPAVLRAIGWAAGLVVAPLLWALADVVARHHRLVLFRNELTGRPSTYLSEVLYQLHGGKQSVVNVAPLSYIDWYMQRQGWPMLVLLIGGLLLALRYRSASWSIPAALVLIPYVIYVFASFIVPRNLDTAIPFTTILCAAALVSVVSWLRAIPLRASLLPALALVLVVVGTVLSWPLSGERSGYARAATFLRQHRAGGALVSSELMVFYLRGAGRTCDAPQLRHDAVRLAADVRAGYRYAVLDHYSWELAKYVRAHMPLVARFPVAGNALGARLVHDEQYPRTARAQLNTVNVYRLRASLLPAPGGSAPDVCSRERV